MGNTINCKETTSGSVCIANTIVLSDEEFKNKIYNTCKHIISSIVYDNTTKYYTLEESLKKLRGAELDTKKVLVFNDDLKKLYSINYDLFIRILISYSQYYNRFNFEDVLYSHINNATSCFQKLKIHDKHTIEYNKKKIPSFETAEFEAFAKTFLTNYKTCNYGIVKVSIKNNKHHDSFILIENENNNLSMTYYNTFIQEDKDTALENINYLYDTLKVANNKLKIFSSIKLSTKDNSEITEISSSLCVVIKLFWLYSVSFVATTFAKEKIHLSKSENWVKYVEFFFKNLKERDYYNLLMYFTGYLLCKYQNNYDLARDLSGKEFASFVHESIPEEERELYDIKYTEAPFDKKKYYAHILCLKDTQFVYKTNKKKLFDVCNMNYECDSECCISNGEYNGGICSVNQECNPDYYE